MVNRKFLTFAGRILGMSRRNPFLIPSYLRHEAQRLWGRSLSNCLNPDRAPAPAYISLNPTRRCNLKCRMCMQYRHNDSIPENLNWYDSQRELPLPTWVELLDQLVAWRPIILITGGEPLVYPDIMRLIEEAQKRRFVVHLQTNGVLLAKFASEIVALGMEMVSVSLDGPPDVHDHIRGQKGSFQRSTEGFRALAKARANHKHSGPILDIRCTISKNNLGALDQMVPLALKLGADTLNFSHTFFCTDELVARHNQVLSPKYASSQGLTLIPPSIPKGEYYRSEIGPQDIPLLLSGIRAIKNQSQGRLKVGFAPNLPERLIIPYYLNLDYVFPQVCDGLWSTCRIMPDGSVSPCLHLTAGNITTTPLADIWNNQCMRQLRHIMNTHLFPGCARCCNRRFA